MWVVVETYENLELWEPVAVWGSFRTAASAQKYVESRRDEWLKDMRIGLDVREVIRP